MKGNIKYFIWLAIAGIVLVGLFGADAGSDGSLIIGLSEMHVKEDTENAGGLDAEAFDAPMPIYALVYDALVEYGPYGKPLPGLAESWEISEDGKEYTFHLREGVKFSDGTPFNATAVKFTMERLKAKRSAGWMSMDDFSNIEIKDPYTITFYYDKPSYPILQELMLCRPQRIMSPSSVEPYGDPNGTYVKSVGTGPFQFDNYEKDQEYILVRNENYWGDRPTINKVVFKLIPDETTRLMALKAGEIDLIGSGLSTIHPGDVADLKANSDLTVVTQEGDMAFYIIPNYEREPYNDVKVRQAINYAINKDELSKSLFAGIYKEAKGAYSPTMPYYKESYENGIIKGYSYDPEKAKQLLADAGWRDADGDGVLDKDGKPFEAKLIIPSVMPWSTMGISNQQPLAEAIQAYLKDIGIKVDIVSMEGGAWWDAATKSYDYDMYIYGPWGAIYDPPCTLRGYWYTGGRLKYSDPEFDKMIDSAVASTDESSRQETYDNIFTYMDENALVVPLYQDEKIFAMRSDVKGFEISPIEYILNLTEVKI